MMKILVFLALILLQAIVIATSQNNEPLYVSNLFLDTHTKTVNFNLRGSKYTYPLDQFGLPGQKALNILIDSVLNVAVHEVNSSLPVPDIDETTTKKIGFITVKVHLSAEQGLLSDARTLERKGDAKLVGEDDGVKLTLVMGFEHLSVNFRNYTVELLNMKFHGKISTTVQENTLQLIIKLKKTKDECSLGLDSFKLIEFNKIKVSATGLGPPWFSTRILSWLLNHFKDRTKLTLEAKISTIIRKMLDENQAKICDLMKLYKSTKNLVPT